MKYVSVCTFDMISVNEGERDCDIFYRLLHNEICASLLYKYKCYITLSRLDTLFNCF